jgi:hypothetical protein
MKKTVGSLVWAAMAFVIAAAEADPERDNDCRNFCTQCQQLCSTIACRESCVISKQQCCVSAGYYAGTRQMCTCGARR